MSKKITMYALIATIKMVTGKTVIKRVKHESTSYVKGLRELYKLHPIAHCITFEPGVKIYK